jgi:glucose-1-phosphate thymidylyltransferase
LREAADADSATVFVYRVHNPEEYGVLEVDAEGKPIGIVEKPERPRSSLAVTGLYFYPPDVVDVAASIQPSARGELEITDVNRSYLHQQRLRVARLTRGHAWLDAGTHESLVAAANFVETIEKRQGLKVACIEEVAYRMGYISDSMLATLAEGMPQSGYGAYLTQLLSDSE